MAVSYHVYSNDGNGGPVDYTNPIATVSGTTYSVGPVSPSSDTIYAVRAFDTDTGLEEANTNVRVRVVIDAEGNDVSGRPNPPHAVWAVSTSGGSCRVTWGYAPNYSCGAPDGFHVYVQPTQDTVPSAPLATVKYVKGRVGYSVALPGPLAPAMYKVSVGSYNVIGEVAQFAEVTIPLGAQTSTYDMDVVSVSYN
jgi:hypothetical protein